MRALIRAAPEGGERDPDQRQQAQHAEDQDQDDPPSPACLGSVVYWPAWSNLPWREDVALDDLVCERSRHSKTARFGRVWKRGDTRSFGKGESTTNYSASSSWKPDTAPIKPRT